MATLPSGRYQLKSLHEEISLFDRKLAHLHKYETFASEAERDASAGKLSSKRNLLVRKAQQMIDEGVEFHEFERPQSLRPEIEATGAAAKPSETEEAIASEPEAAIEEEGPSSPGGFSFDLQKAVDDYKKNRINRRTR